MDNTLTHSFIAPTGSAGQPMRASWPTLGAAWRLVLLCCVLALGAASPARASHFRYGNITWRTVTTDATGRTVQLKVSESFRRSFFSGNIVVGSVVSVADNLYFGDGGVTSINLTVTSVDVAADNFYGEFTVTHTYPAAINYTAYFSSSARLSTLFNNANGTWYVKTIVNAGTGNNSPVSTLPPVVNLATGQAAAAFQLAANDPDGDPLTYSLATSADLNGTAFTNAPGLAINATTGGITFNTVSAPVGRIYDAMVKVSDGKTVVLVDFIIQITNVSAPPKFDYSITPSNNYVYQVAPGTPINFSVRATDSDAGDIVTLKGIGLPPGASMSPALPATGNPVLSTFSWTPTTSTLGTSVITFVAQDAVGVQTNTSVTIQVSTKPTFDVPPTPSNGSIVQITPGTLVTRTIQASNVDPGTLVRIMSATGLPASASYSPALPTPAANPTSTQLNWTPVVADWGLKAATFTAQNTNSSDQSTHSLQFVVNSAPSFTSTPAPASLSVVAGQPFSYSISMTDPDLPYGDKLEIETPTLPAWLTLVDNGDGTGTVSGTPAVADAGSNPVTLVAADLYHHGASYGLITQSFSITVIPCTVQAHATPLTLVLDANGTATLTTAQFDGGSTASCGIALMTLSQSAFSCANYGANPVTLTVTDANGNVSTDTQTVLVDDTMAPTAVAQNVTVYLDANGQASITAAQVNNGSSDNCGAITLSLQKQGLVSAFSQAQEHSVLTLSAPAGAVFTAVNFASYGTPNFVNGTFQYGNCNATNSQSIVESYVLNQNTASILADNSVFGDPCYGTFKRLAVQATYTLGSPVPQLAYTCANVGSANNPVLLTVTDAYGHVSTATANVTVLDAIAPTAVAQNVTVQLDANGQASVTAAQVNNGSADNCGVANVSVSSGSFTCANLGANPVTLTVTDASGNVSTATATVTVLDNILPTITAPAALTVSADAGQCSATGVALGTATAADNCSAMVASNAPATFAKGTTTVTWTATDASGNTATATQLVTVNDTEAPTISAPAMVSVSADLGQCSASHVALGNPVAGDNCTGVMVTSNAPAVFLKGLTTVTWTATDAVGLTATATQVVTVLDVENPIISAPAAVVVSANPGQCSATGVALGNAIATDNCSGVTVANNAPATFAKGSTTVIWIATDAAGNKATATQTVTVNDTERPNLMVPANMVVSAPATQCGATVSFNPTATDNCAGATVVASPASGSTFPVGTSTVSVTATDASGNTSTGSFTMTVNDVTAPTVATRTVTVTLVNGVASVTAEQVDNGSTDACGIRSLSLNRTSFSCANLGNNPVILTVTDIHGNVASAPATVSVVGTIPAPAIAVTPSSTVYTGGVATNLYIGYGAQSATLTASGGVSYVWIGSKGLSSNTVSNPVFTATTLGTFTFTVTATNQYGCTATATVTLHVINAYCDKDKVIVCHNGHEICISPNAVPAHLTGHPGDQLGNCTTAVRGVAANAPVANSTNELSVFPNPAADKATVSFRTAENGAAQVVVYNLLGQRIATLYDGTVTAGQLYSATLNSANLSTGLYVCRLVTNGKTESLRLNIER
ncbi:HYR domain-containing protein [Hymenobacter siberiensis]|uniref:HYR domain-containing protein n=1 Tax=Hymenobacter siberiensis TaxID=2848396 RepID=UPI001C1DD5CC|nr:HYR domain-containing protein [Hymenobacter siberiensis]MBU6119472.1 HYR domain-containing protein [Hymenobacter siberiensis]